MDRQIAIVKDGSPVQVFRAPDDKFAARSLWVFLVDHLRPGFVVELRSASGAAEIVRPSGRQVPGSLYRSLMEQD